MGKIKIYLSLREGELYYRDSEEHKGHTIDSSVDPGDSITWKLDQCSGIKAITNITVEGQKDFFKDGPDQKDFDSWKAEVSKKAKGEISYVVEVEKCDCNCKNENQLESTSNRKLNEPKLPVIIIRV
jgi:hypothetical protein